MTRWRRADAKQYRDLVAASMTEDRWQALVVLEARARGWRVYHTHDSRRSAAGFPDLVLVRPPRVVFAEAEDGVGTGFALAAGLARRPRSLRRRRGVCLAARRRRLPGGAAMSRWVRVDTSMPTHPKFLALSDRALATWLRGLCYCGLHGTDGVVPESALSHVGGERQSASSRELVEAGLWVRNGGGYVVHDYLEYQQAADESERRSESARRAAQARWRKTKP